MKKFTKTMGAALLAMLFIPGFTACTTQPDDAPPVVEIVRRTNLLDYIDLDTVLTPRQKTNLEKIGITPTVSNPRLSGENRAVFDLVFANARGKSIAVNLTGRIDYDKNGDKFENVRLYWGELFTKNGEILLSGINSLTQVDFKTDIPDKRTKDLTADESFKKGTVLTSYPFGDKFCAVMAEEERDYIVEWDYMSDVVKYKRLSDRAGTLSTADSRSVMPFDIGNKPNVTNINGDIFITGDNVLYTDGESFYCKGERVARTDDGNLNLTLYKLGMGDGLNRRDCYVAVKSEGNTDTLAIISAGLMGNTNHQKTFVIDDGYRIHCAATGLEMDIDFGKGRRGDIRYKITAEMLGEKLYTSPNKNYILYKYAPETTGETETYSVAMLEKSTGKITNLGNIGKINSVLQGETGFDHNGNAYILNEKDLQIFTTDVDNPTPIFSLSDHKEPNGNTFLLCAAYNQQTDQLAVAYFTYTAGQTDTYNIAVDIFDPTGDLKGIFLTGVGTTLNSPNPVAMYPKGGNFVMTMSDGATGKTLERVTVTPYGEFFIQ